MNGGWRWEAKAFECSHMARKRMRMLVFERMVVVNKTGKRVAFSTMVVAGFCVVVPSPGVETEANK